MKCVNCGEPIKNIRGTWYHEISENEFWAISNYPKGGNPECLYPFPNRKVLNPSIRNPMPKYFSQEVEQ